MGQYKRPRLSLVVDQDIKELLDTLSKELSIPASTLAASILGDGLKAMAKERGLLGKKTSATSDRRT